MLLSRTKTFRAGSFRDVGPGLGLRDKDVLLATFRRDEAEAAHGIKKFNCAVEAHGIVLSRKVSFNRPRGPLRSLGVSKYRERDVLVVGAMSCRQSKSAPTIGCAVDHLYGRCHINKQAQSSVIFLAQRRKFEPLPLA